MYGGPVPALAELVANAWDADAHEVDLTLPLGQPPTPDSFIVIKDDGRGMTWEDVEHQYLVIGRNRRHGGKDETRSGRPVMGHKGIGKLAGFGIARIVELRTVRNRWLTHFSMDYDKMTSDTAIRERYEPDIIADEQTKERPSTTVILRDLYLKRAVPEQQFLDSLARRFAVLDSKFVVKVNGKPLLRSEMPLPFRRPKEKGRTMDADIPGFGRVKYWYGFTKDTIQDDDARGIAIFARGRMAQVPSLFGLSQGIWNQASMQYLTGEVYADELDDTEDLISTNRQSINWKEQGTAALQEWGQDLIKRAAREYDDHKKRFEREQFLAPLGRVAVERTETRLARLPQTVARVADRLISNYKAVSEGKARNGALEDAVDGIFSLAEEAGRGSGRSGASLIRSRRSSLNAVAHASKLSEYAAFVRQNPWVVLSAWRIVVTDDKATRDLKPAKERFSSLASISIWIIRHESRRYLVAVGEAGPQVLKSLDSLANKVPDSIGHRLDGVILVADQPQNYKARRVQVQSASRLIESSIKSCDVLLEILGES
jgi:hypothetical protein